MSYIAKSLGLIAAMMVVVPAGEIPGFLKEPWDLMPAALAQSAEARKVETNRLFQQGIQQFNRSQLRAAMQSWEQALAIYREVDDRQGEGAVLGNLGNAYLSLGDYRRAIVLHEQSLAVTREIGDWQAVFSDPDSRGGDESIPIPSQLTNQIHQVSESIAREDTLPFAHEVLPIIKENNENETDFGGDTSVKPEKQPDNLAESFDQRQEIEFEPLGLPNQSVAITTPKSSASVDYELRQEPNSSPQCQSPNPQLVTLDPDRFREMLKSFDERREIALRKGKYNLALNCAKYRLEISESLEDSQEISRSYRYLGAVLSRLGKTDEAIESFAKASEELNAIPSQGRPLLTYKKCQILIEAADTFKKEGEFRDALGQMKSCISLLLEETYFEASKKVDLENILEVLSAAMQEIDEQQDTLDASSIAALNWNVENFIDTSRKVVEPFVRDAAREERQGIPLTNFEIGNTPGVVILGDSQPEVSYRDRDSFTISLDVLTVRIGNEENLNQNFGFSQDSFPISNPGGDCNDRIGWNADVRLTGSAASNSGQWNFSLSPGFSFNFSFCFSQGESDSEISDSSILGIEPADPVHPSPQYSSSSHSLDSPNSSILLSLPIPPEFVSDLLQEPSQNDGVNSDLSRNFGPYPVSELNIGDRSLISDLYRILGDIQLIFNSYDEAIDSYERALKDAQSSRDQSREAVSLNSLGVVYLKTGNFNKAHKIFNSALTLSKVIHDPELERIVLGNIALLYEEQGKPEVAVIFYKQSINISESIRASSEELSRDYKDAYRDSVSGNYRRLADLLIQQGRLAEAQRVLELLKVQELQDFTRSAELAETQGTIHLIALERQILAEFNGLLMELAKALYDCEQTQCSQLTALRDQLDTRTLAFNSEVATFRKDLQDQLAQDPGILSADRLSSTARDVVTAQPGIGTVLVYPLVLEDRVQILIAVRAGEGGVAFRAVEAPVDQVTLWRTVNQFRDLLDTPNSSIETVQSTAAQLYNWLIAPLEQELSVPEIDHLVFALDRSTRYIPMGALFDANNQEYLVEKYAVSTILGADLTDKTDRLSTDVQDNPVLGLGLSQPVDGFSALRHVSQEVNAIVDTNTPDSQGLYPGQVLLDDDFTYVNLRDALAGNRMLHIATHASFQLGLPQNSFLLGSEGRITIDRIQLLGNYGLNNVHLVVLSACETAVGGPDDNGIEIPGISYYFLGGGAKSVMASLWLVNDHSTSLFMQEFYRQLATGQTSKAEALRTAQRAFIQNEGTIVDAWQRGFVVDEPIGTDAHSLSHPYYWSPFILIGNGL